VSPASERWRRSQSPTKPVPPVKYASTCSGYLAIRDLPKNWVGPGVVRAIAVSFRRLAVRRHMTLGAGLPGVAGRDGEPISPAAAQLTGSVLGDRRLDCRRERVRLTWRDEQGAVAGKLGMDVPES